MKLSRKVMLSEVTKLCLLLALVGAAPTLPAPAAARSEVACERRVSWWDRARGVCAPCTRCEPRRAVRLPCEPHRDTVCQPLHEVHIPFEPITNNDSDNDYYYEDYEDYSEVSDDDNVVRWDIQATTLLVAAIGCVVFFVVVIYVSFYHTKQWKVLKQALRSDVQDLSAKLKLMEAGETPAQPVVPTDHHIYCNVHVDKDTQLKPAVAKKGLGNVYTQEKHPT